MCLLAKIWGESVPLPLIVSKTKLDWKYIKGPVEYIELGNGWILLKFATVIDRDYVWTNRPWFVKGLNLVLNAWKPFFDPYSATIQHIDQWIRISRLPWEFWEEKTLISLLHSFGTVIRIDHNTLLRKKGRFARVCLHLDVSQPLPGTLSIPTPNCPLLIPITYEGLHEVCALCGTPDHLLDHCPSLPVAPKLEVVVEKFRNQAINDPSPSCPSAQPDMGGNWIRISPKKRGRSFGPSQLKQAVNPPSVGIRIVEPVSPVAASGPQKSQLPLGKGKEVEVAEQSPAPFLAADNPSPVVLPNPAVMSNASSSVTMATVVLPGLDLDPSGGVLSPNSALEASEVFSSPAVSPGDDVMEYDGTEDYFLDLPDLDEPVASSDSSKKRKLEEGEEFSSPFLP